jgi:hypothetical protein
LSRQFVAGDRPSQLAARLAEDDDLAAVAQADRALGQTVAQGHWMLGRIRAIELCAEADSLLWRQDDFGWERRQAEMTGGELEAFWSKGGEPPG